MANAKSTEANNEAGQLARLRRRARGALLTAAISVCLLLVVMAALTFLGLFAFDQHQTLEAHKTRELVTASEHALQNGDPTLATLLVLEALPKADQRNRAQPFQPEAEVALYRSLSQMTERRRYDGVIEYAPTSEMAVAALQSEAEIRIVDVVTDRELSKIAIASDDVVELELSSDATKFAVVHEDRTVSVWDVATGVQTSRFEIEGEEEQPYVRFLADATTLSYLPNRGASGNSHRSLVDVATGAKISIDSHTEFLAMGSLRHVEGRRWLTARSVDKSFLLIDFDQRTVVAELEGPFGSWVESATSADGRWLAFANRDDDYRSNTRPALLDNTESPVFVLDLVEGTVAHRFDGHHYGLDSLAFDEDNKFLLGGSDGKLNDTHIIKWSLESGEVVAELRQDRMVSDPHVQFLPGSRGILIAGSDYRAVWNEDLKSVKAGLAGHHDSIWRTHVDDQQSSLVIESNLGYVSFYRLHDFEMTAEREFRDASGQRVTSLRIRSFKGAGDKPWDSSNQYALMSGEASWVDLLSWDGKLIDRIGAGAGGVYGADRYGDENMLVLYEKGGRITVHMPRPRVNAIRLEDLTGSNLRTTFSASGNRFAIPEPPTFGRDHDRIRVYDREALWEMISEFQVAGDVGALAFGQTEDDLIGTIVSAEQDQEQKSVSFFHYDLKSEKLSLLPIVGVLRAYATLPMPGQRSALLRLEYEEEPSKDGWYVFSYGEAGLKHEADKRIDEFGYTYLNVVRDRYVISDDEESIRIFDLQTLQTQSLPKKGISKRLYGFDVSFDGKFLVGSRYDGHRIWDLTTGELIESRLFEGIEPARVSGLRFAPNSHHVIYVLEEERVIGPVEIVIGDLSSGEVIRRLGPFDQWGIEASLSPSEDVVLTKRIDVATLIDVETGLPLRRWENAMSIRFAPSGKHLICSCAGGKTIIPLLPRGDALIDLARENLPPHRNKLTREEIAPYAVTH